MTRGISSLTLRIFLMVTDTAPYRYPFYHTEQDTPDKVDYERLARVVTGLYEMLRELANP